ncbi:VOC family protein [Chloroflexota bacterium]
MITGMQHSSFTVSNLEEAIHFFRDLLGFEATIIREVKGERMEKLHKIPGASLRICNIITPGNGHIELLEFTNPKGKKIDLTTCNHGVAHIAFLVDDIQKTYEELSAKGVNFNCPPLPITAGELKGWNGCYLRGLDGITFELMEPPKGVETHPVTGFIVNK